MICSLSLAWILPFAFLLLVTAYPALAQSQGVYEHYEVYDADFFPPSEYAARRKLALSKIESGAGMLVRNGDVRNRSNDVDYEFRQRNNLLYLTGITETQSALLLLPNGIEIEGKSVREILFVAERNPSHEIWEGIRMGPKVAATITGISTVLSYEELPEILDGVVPELDKLYYDNWLFGVITEPIVGEEIDWPGMMLMMMAEDGIKIEVVQAGEILDGMRAIKSEAEIEMMKKAVEISAEGHREAMRYARPGMAEYELEALMEYTFHRLGAEEPGYPSIVGAGPNTCILHYNTNRRKSQDGDLVLMDCGAEYHGYSADITRTFPVNGKFTPEQRAIYDLVLKAQNAAIKECASGVQFFEPHRKAARIIAEGLVQLGIMESGDDVRTYFMHGTSHFLGMDVHDVSDSYVLTPGMVLTVEPGIYIAEGSDCDPKWWNIGVRIEDDILVTEEGSINLSAGLEKTASEIEKLVGSKNK